VVPFRVTVNPGRAFGRPVLYNAFHSGRQKGGVRMIKVSILYPSGENHTFDMAYYLDKHGSLIRQKVGPALKGVAVDEGIGGMDPDSRPPYMVIGHLFFDSMEALQSSFAPHIPVFLSDIPNFTNVTPTVQISEVKL
jgi:uncharacterized protein (TIGR02118 family)